MPTSSFQLQQCGKPSSSAYELLWWAHFHDVTSLHHQDPIGVLGAGQAMGHSQYRAAAAHDCRTDCGMNGGLAGAIDCGHSLVEQQHGRVPHQGPSEGGQLALSGGELHAPAQQRVIPLGQRLDEGVRPGDGRGTLDGLSSPRPITQCEIVDHRTPEELHHLLDRSHGAPTLAIGQQRWVGANHPDCPAPRAVESAQQV
jgi:hypothetical protein